MGKKFEETQIGPFRVMSNQMPALEAFSLLPVLGSLVSSGASELEGASGFSLDGEIDVPSLGRAFGALFRELEAKGAEDLACKILRHTTVINKEEGEKFELSTPDKVNAAFCGNIQHMIHTMAWVVQFNFSDFFSGDLMQKAMALGQKMTKAEENPSD